MTGLERVSRFKLESSWGSCTEQDVTVKDLDMELCPGPKLVSTCRVETDRVLEIVLVK